jgi:hypothetical protein
MADRALRFDLLGRDRTLGRTFDQAERRSKRFGVSMGKVAGLIGTAFAGIAVTRVFAGFIDEGREAQKVGRQTDAVIKSTGKAAGLTAKGFERLAGRLSDYAAIDDEIIQGGENILATFTRIRAGGPEKVFERASKAALDMAAAMGHGEVNADNLQSANLRLGKALQDPLKGISALTRVGVTFSKQQKEQIADFVKQGKTAQAQGVILDEVAREFGGSAGAAATGWDRFKVALGNFQEFVGTALVPIIDRAGRFLGGTLMPALEGFAKTVSERFGPALGSLTEAVQEKFDTFKLDAKVFGRNLAARIKGTANAVIIGFQAGLKSGDWSQLGEIIGNVLRQAVGNGIDLIKRAFGGVDWFKIGKEATFIAVPFAFGFFDSLLSALFKQFKEHPWESTFAVLSLIPLGRAAGALAKVLGKLPILGPLLRGLERAGGLLEKPIGGIVGAVVRFFGAAIERAFPGIGRRIGDWAVRWILGVASRYTAMRKAGGRFIAGLVDGILDQIGLVIRNIIQVIGWLTRPFRAAGGWLIRAGMSLIGGLIRGIGSMLGAVVRTIGGVVLRLTSPFRNAAGWLIGRGRDLVSGLIAGIRSALGSVGGVLRSLRDAIVGGIRRLFGISSPSRVMAGLGASMVAGLVRGLITNAGSLRAVIKSIGGDITTWFGAMFGGIGQGGTSGNIQKLAQRMAAGYGWTGAQWNALRTLVQNESGWNPNAQNPTSSAYGLFQFLDSTWGGVGATKTSSPVGQIAAGLRYIKQRYGSPASALSFWMSHTPHWYGEGGIFTKPTVIGVGEAGPEAVIPLGRAGIDEDRLARKIAAELARVIPTSISVRDIQAGMNLHAGRMGQAPVFR